MRLCVNVCCALAVLAILLSQISTVLTVAAAAAAASSPKNHRLRNSGSHHNSSPSVIATAPLVRCITPGINQNNKVEIRKPFRVLYQPPGEAVDPGYVGNAEFVNASAERILVSGKPVIALVATYGACEDISRIGGQVVVMAFFRMQAGKPILIDAVDIATDRFCGFSTEPILHYKTGTDAVVIENSHFNSSENFCALTPVALVSERLIALCNDVPILYNAKSSRVSLVEQGRLIVGASTGALPKPMSMSIKVTCKTYDESDGDKILSTHSKSFMIPFKLHGKTYSVNSKGPELAALNDFVKKNGFDAP